MRDGAPHTVLVAGSSLLGVRHAFCPSPASAPAWHCVYTPGSQPGSTHMDNPGRVKGRVDRRAPPSGAGPCMRTGALRVPLPAAACPHTGDRMQTEASAAAPPPPPPAGRGVAQEAGGGRGRGGEAGHGAGRFVWIGTSGLCVQVGVCAHGSPWSLQSPAAGLRGACKAGGGGLTASQRGATAQGSHLRSAPRHLGANHRGSKGARF